MPIQRRPASLLALERASERAERPVAYEFDDNVIGRNGFQNIILPAYPRFRELQDERKKSLPLAFVMCVQFRPQFEIDKRRILRLMQSSGVP